ATGAVDPEFIVAAVDFIRSYADRCHHGKEEDILFRDLKKKPLSAEHARILGELEAEHVKGREVTRGIVAAYERYLRGDKASVGEMIRLMEVLAEFYPKHIEKEDRHFFIPCMAYFTEGEKENMLAECYEFDRRLIHEKYEQGVQKMERER
ncbi:MAG TPA: hemerythrin domain-containing protein, partial [Candidatus Omnitrophota bacterium]|nr:hemerythrin domain-containing protein [Candidatus Omnitrophota bacterium]